MHNLDEIFSPGGRAATALGNAYEYREQQIHLANEVYSTLEKDAILIAEAGTGSGKTLAYLIPLLLHCQEKELRAAVSTETRTLQNQIAEKDLPAAERMLDRKINWEICYGVSNYICKRRLERVIDRGDFGPDMESRLSSFLEWESQTREGTFQDYGDYVPVDFQRRVGRDSEKCLGRRCPHYEESHYFIAREKWNAAEILIVNHSLLTAHLALEGQLLPTLDCLVIDEAHRFPRVFSSGFHTKGGYAELNRAVAAEEGAVDNLELLERLQNDLKSLCDNRQDVVIRLRKELNLESAIAMREAIALLHKKSRQRLQEVKEMNKTLFDETDESTTTEESGPEKELNLKSQVQLLQVQEELLDSLIEGPDDNQVHWIRWGSSDTQWEYYAAPIYCGDLIRETLEDCFKSIVYASATVCAPGKTPFDYFSREVGLHEAKKVRNLRLDSPFDFTKQAMLYLPRNLPDPAREESEFHAACAQLIAHLLGETGGGTLVLFNSARALKTTHALMQQDGKIPEAMTIFSQLELGAGPALASFMDNDNSALFGLSSYRQGLDIRGDGLRMVIIVRLPFGAPDDPLLEARMDLEKSAGQKPFFTIQLPEAAINLKQGFGRLIRSKSDRGAVCILDPRLRSRSYGKDIMSVLPHAMQVLSFGEFRAKYRLLMKADAS